MALRIVSITDTKQLREEEALLKCYNNIIVRRKRIVYIDSWDDLHCLDIELKKFEYNQ